MDTPQSPRWSDRFAYLVGLAIATVFAVVFITILGSVRADRTDRQLNELQRNHDVSVCVISLFHDLSASSGTTDAERKAAYEEIFAEDWLRLNCNLTDGEAREILSP